MTVAAAAAHSWAGTPVAASALNRRAPSMWTGTGPAASTTARRPSVVHGAPEAAMCVCSMLTSDTSGWWCTAASRARRTSSARSMPSSSSSSTNWIPAFMAAAPYS